MQLLIVFLVGALSVLAYAPFNLSPLAFICWAVLFHLLREASAPRRAAVLAYLWGFGALFAGLCWLVVALNRYGGMAAPLAILAIVLFCAALAIYAGLAGWIFARLRQKLRPCTWWHEALLAAALWTLGEWLRGAVFPAFPWLAIGYTQTPPSPLAGWAPLFGSYGLTFLVCLLAALLAIALRENGNRIRAVVAIAAIVAVGAGLRSIAWTEPVGMPTRFALLQTNIAQDQKWQAARVMDWLKLNYEAVRKNPAQVVVLPETSLPLLVDQLPEGYLDALTDTARAVHGDVIIGVFTRDDAGGIHNSAITRGVSAPQKYSKRHLVPFGEFAPPLFGWFYKLAHIPMADQSRGPANQAPLQLGGQKIAVNICYEDVFGEELLYALPEATVMLNISNLAWYGDSHAQPQHLQIARMRAMETGRPMLRATNTGMTAVVAPNGRVMQVLPAFTAGALTADVRGYQGMTPYARWANWPVLLLCWGVLSWAAYCHIRRKIG